MTSDFAFTEKEKLLRKEWLILTIIISFVMTPLKIAYAFWTLSMPNMNTNERSSTIFTLGVFVFLFSFLSFLMFYKCAYKKPGTKVLTVSLILFTLGLLSSVSALFKISSILEACIFIIQFSFSIWLGVLSYKMRELNQKIKTSKNLPSQP